MIGRLWPFTGKVNCYWSYNERLEKSEIRFDSEEQTPLLRYTEHMATIDIGNLSLEERLRLLDELWESLSQTAEAIPLTSAQREELDRRLDELEREGPVGIPWEDVLRRIRCRAH
jgi:putative addiction module component (TIGR02574 family)